MSWAIMATSGSMSGSAADVAALPPAPDYVLAFFSESDESVKAVAEVIGNGIAYTLFGA